MPLNLEMSVSTGVHAQSMSNRPYQETLHKCLVSKETVLLLVWVLSKELIKVELPPSNIWKADLSSVGSSSERMTKGTLDTQFNPHHPGVKILCICIIMWHSHLNDYGHS